ncbi:MAG: 3-phosphoshikimate 1-carboxyvinyltransferase, partial [Propionibacteriaceae bacterium]|nr:3-phosphoshikimate 1-carboxyvinyltransferase [Propionibacteriaceae bacterium]
MSRPVASRWTAPTAEGPLNARVSLPGSKSAAARALVLAALAQGPSRLRGLPDARDTELMRDGLAGFGVRCADGAITPPTALEAGSVVDCGLAGTVMRFLPAVASLADGPTRFVGDQRASSRPVAPLLAALARLGASVDGDSLPFSVAGRAVGRRVEVDASASSQFVSALLLIGPRLPHGLALRHVGGALPSAPHIEMTLLMLRQRGVEAATTSQTSWEVAPGEIAALDCAIEPDLTNT